MQMEPNAKKTERPAVAESQSKTVAELEASPTKPIRPHAKARMMVAMGRPLLSMYMNIEGIMPSLAMAWRVRVEPKMALLPTERTERVMTTLKTEGRPRMPASLMARTNGESAVLAPEAPRREELLDGTTSPSISSEIM